MRSLTTLFLISLTVLSKTICPAQFVHPGMLYSKAELDFLKEKIRSKAEPWYPLFGLIQSDDRARPEWEAKPVAHIIRGTYNRPNIGAGNLGHDAQAAYIHALQWALTDDELHARKVIEILNAWSSTLQSVSGDDARLLVGIVGYKFCNAAEIIRHTSPFWKPEDQLSFEKILLDVFYPVIKNYRPDSNGNWYASMIVTTMCMGIFLDNEDLYRGALGYVKTGRTTGAIPNYIYESGQCQENGRDQGHTQLGLGYLADACEIAWKQGEDLYGAFGNRLAIGFEYTARYNLGFGVPYDPVPDIFGNHLNPAVSEKGRGNFRPVYEKVYHHYHNRKGPEMKYTKMVQDKIRPEGYHWGHSSFGTLLYAYLPVFPPGQQTR